MSAKYDFDMDQGATFNRSLTLKDDNGDVVNITNNTFAGQIRTSALSGTVAGTFAFTIVNGSGGIFNWKMTATNTAALPAQQCVYDVEMTQANGDVVRLLEGFVNIKSNVTR
tara:strand:- start:424 stop:759 length:336 start_codon:yes stop_codon:yes gene_type:complete